ncbi:MAG: LacI family transcriptional regulator [Betaproteobacteria bacterium]|nr:LacI family transcriptional regulator [Betaproteobacteria bacterium]
MQSFAQKIFQWLYLPGDTLNCQPQTRPQHLVTIKHIAQHLGVAASTVARALSQDKRISVATQAKVAQAAQELGYVAHSAARQMRSQRSGMVGLVIPDVLNAFYSTAAQAISQSFDEAGYQMVLCISEDKPETEMRQVRSLAEARVDGIVWVPCAKPLPPTMAWIQSIAHVQLIRKCPQIKSDWFGIDDVATTEQATQHLLTLGHRHIAYVGGPKSLSTGRDRLKGYTRAMQSAGANIDAQAVFCDAPDAVSGQRVMLQLLALQPRPTAVVVSTSRGTEGVLEALRLRSIAVPQDLSVVGFNDSSAMAWWGPGLTTMRMPVREVASASASHLIRALGQTKSAPAPTPGMVTHYPPTLMVRGSTTRAPNPLPRKSI